MILIDYNQMIIANFMIFQKQFEPGKENDMILTVYSETDYSGIQLMIDAPYDFNIDLKDKNGKSTPKRRK